MYTLCATEKTARQQRQFEQCFLQMLLESDYDTITISQLCRQTGLSRKIFYRLFEKKADVLYALIDHTLLESARYFPDETGGEEELRQFLSYWVEQRALLDVLLQHHNSSLLTDRAIRFLMQESTGLSHLFGADADKFAFETVVFYASGLFSLILAWHARGFSHSIDEMAAALMRVLTSAPIDLRKQNK